MRSQATHIIAPAEYTDTRTSIFLAGGITGCPEWQSELVELLATTRLVLLNPRRENFPIHDPRASEIQIAWEHRYLRVATAISFWFPKEALCPIALYELGAWSMSDKPIFIGVHPEYQRRRDVEIQTKLVRPEIRVCYSLKDISQQIINWNK